MYPFRSLAVAPLLAVGLCLMAGKDARAVDTTRRSAQPKLADKASELSEQVEEALLNEVKGSNDQREKILKSILEETPDHPSARWHSGYVWFSKQWLDYRQFPKELRQDKRITDYWDLRDRCQDVPEHHLKLGQWCYQRKLVDQARAHWTRVLDLDPENADARELLGHQNLGEEWLTEEQLQQLQEAKQTEEGHTKATAKWGRELASIGKNLQSKSQKQREYAKQRLLETDDPGIVGPLVSVLAGQTEELDQVVVEVLGRIKTPESSMALARLAVMSPWRPVRTAAARQLRPRKIDDYAPLLLAAASTETVSQFQVQPAPSQRSVYYRHLFFREGRDRKEVAALNRTYQIDLQSVAPKLDMRDCLLDAEARARQWELWKERQNLGIREMNERIAEAIYEATDRRLPASPADWWKWWDEINEVYVTGEKKVVAYAKNEHVQVSSDVTVIGRAAAPNKQDNKGSGGPAGAKSSPGGKDCPPKDRAKMGRDAMAARRPAAQSAGPKPCQQVPSPQMPWHGNGWNRATGVQDLPQAPANVAADPRLKAVVSSERPVASRLKDEPPRLKADVSRDKPTYSSEKDVVSREKDEVSGLKADVSREKPAFSGEKPLVSRERPELSSEKDGVSREKPLVSGEKDDLPREKDGVSREKPLVSGEKDDLPREKPAISRVKGQPSEDASQLAADERKPTQADANSTDEKSKGTAEEAEPASDPPPKQPKQEVVAGPVRRVETSVEERVTTNATDPSSKSSDTSSASKGTDGSSPSGSPKAGGSVVGRPADAGAGDRDRIATVVSQSRAQRYDCLAPGTKVWTESGLCASRMNPSSHCSNAG